MLELQRFKVSFDDGHEVEAQLKSRDLAVIERDGVDFSTAPPVQGAYMLAFTALQRMKRAGLIDFDLPDDVDGLIEVADIEPIVDEDPEGKGSAPVAEPGSPPS